MKMPDALTVLILAATFVLANSFAQGLPVLATSYVEAQELGRNDEKDPATMEYHRSVLLPAFSARYRAHLRNCQAALPEPDQSPFSFVAALDSAGNVLRIWSDRSPAVYSCVRGRLLFERFPPPPRAPFYLYIHMRFAN